MKKTLLKVFTAMAVMVGCTAIITTTSTYIAACEHCKIKGLDPHERVCGKCKKKGMKKTKSELKNGVWHVNYKCNDDSCGHTHVYKTTNIYEI